MDAESPQSTHDAWSSDHAGAVSSSSRHSGPPISQCMICRRAFFLEAEVIEGLEPISMCRYCKAMVLDGGETTGSSPRRRPRQRGGSRHRSSESIEDLFSQQFSQLISFARQNQVDGDDANSNISVGGYGESDASVNGYSLFDNESDTDIDPMRTGLDGWISDDGFSDEDPVHLQNRSPMIRSQALFYYRSGDEESEVISRYTLDLGDDIDAMRFDELMESFVEAIGRGRSSSGSVVVKLPDVVISEESGSLVCAVCKDPMPIYSTAKQLPCQHLYHRSCILPWLNVRRTCPVCRYELPAEDLEYEAVKYQEDADAEAEADDVSELEDNGPWSDRGGIRRWMLLAAAPIVGFVGMALVFWLQSQGGHRPRVRWNAGDGNRQNRSRRWWSMI